MKKILVWLCVVTMLMSCIMVTPVALAATPTQMTASDVYISGDWTVGGTLTAHYTWYNPDGSQATAPNPTVYWFCDNAGSAEDTVLSQTGANTYTLKESDVGKKIFFVVFPNGWGGGMRLTSPAYGTVQAANADATAPVAGTASLVLTGNADTVKPGVTLRASYAAAFTNGKAEGETTFKWYTSNLSKTEKTEISGATAQTYTVTDADYGKYIYAEITVKDVDGNAASPVETTVVKVGSKVPVDRSTATYNPNGCYTNNVKVDTQKMFAGMAGTATGYTYGSSTSVSMKIDVGEAVNVDGFVVYAYGNKSDFTIHYSNNGTEWTPIKTVTSSNSATEYVLDNVVTARHFMVKFTASGNCTLYNFYPYLSAENRGYDLINIESADNGITFDNAAKTISGVVYGMPADTLADSINVSSLAEVALTDVEGEVIADTSDIKITDTNCSDYRIKVSSGSAQNLYTISCNKDAYRSLDFSALSDTAEYGKGQTGNNQHIGGYSYTTTYWYDGSNLSYAKKSAEDSDAIAIYRNGAPYMREGAASSNPITCEIWIPAPTDAEDVFVFSFDAKIDDHSALSVNGKAGGTSGTTFKNPKLQINNGSIYVNTSDTGLSKVVNCADNEWYHIDVVIDYKNDTHSIMVDGNVYAENVPFVYSAETVTKTSVAMALRLDITEGGENDVSYLKNIKFTKVWDVTDKITAAGNKIGMTLYNGDSVAEGLTPGATYTAKGNGKLFGDDYFVAIYQAEYADDDEGTVEKYEFIKAYRVAGSKDAQINVSIPSDVEIETYASGRIKKGAMIKMFTFDNNLKPLAQYDMVK